MGVLDGIKIIEFAGLGPAPFCGMLLADMGAEVILIERAKTNDPFAMGDKAIVNRGKKSVELNLKNPRAIDAALRLIEGADALIEGMRPGVMERLGLSPEVCLANNPALIYGRMTGWGQTGPLALTAGHDINYIALSGALWYSGVAGTAPFAPPSLVGDIGGGAMYLALGLVAGILNAKRSGKGQIVDASIVDGSANMMNLLLSFYAAGAQPIERGQGILDGPHWYASYECADGNYVSVAPIEPQFSVLFLQKMGLTDDPAFANPHDKSQWQALTQKLATIFKQQPSAYWCALLEGSDACFAPVLNPLQAAQHPHIAARQIYHQHNGVFQAAPAPRFSATPSNAFADVPQSGADSVEILGGLGLSAEEINALKSA